MMTCLICVASPANHRFTFGQVQNHFAATVANPEIEKGDDFFDDDPQVAGGKFRRDGARKLQ